MCILTRAHFSHFHQNVIINLHWQLVYNMYNVYAAARRSA